MNRRPVNSFKNSASASCGFSLIECLVYIGMFFVVTSLALSVFYRSSDSSRIIARAAEDISSALRAGERWREDVRTATAPLRTENLSAASSLIIPHHTSLIRYRCENGILSRQENETSDWLPVLTGIKSSRMELDQRSRVTAWRWELELNTRRKSPRTLPLFTFEAAPTAATAP